jgi:hypothetical protein
MKKISLFLLLMLSLGIAVYFNGDFVRLYNDLTNKIQDFQKTDIGLVMSEIKKEILMPLPLRVNGTENNVDVVLVKSEIINETNIQRQNKGLSALLENTKLNQAALAKANDMFQKQYFEHESPQGIGPGELVSKQNYQYVAVGENLILGNFASEKEVVEKWMASPGHRENILSKRYTEIGVAVIRGTYKGETVWIGVQEFGLPLSFCKQPDVNYKIQIDLSKIELDILEVEINEKRNQINNIDPKNPIYNQMIDDYNQMVLRYNLLAEEIKLRISEYNAEVNVFNNCVSGQ